MPTSIVQEKPKRRPRVPAGLLYETLNGRPLYYKGYKEVVAGKKTPEEIMGSSSLQAILVSIIHGFLFGNIDRKKYFLATNEAGLHVDNRSNMANDIAIYDKEGLALNDRYFQTPPKVAIELDVKIDVEGFAAREQSYVYEKTERLLDFGVERVIWITTKPQKVFVASRNADWITHNWNVTVPVIDGITLNLAELVQEEGIEL